MRAVIRGDMNTREAVKAYHAHLGEKGIRPKLELEEDQQVTETVLLTGL